MIYTTPRAVFAELVASVLGETRVRPSPMAIAYLIELLDSRVRTATPAAEGASDEATLAEDLLALARPYTARPEVECPG